MFPTNNFIRYWIHVYQWLHINKKTYEWKPPHASILNLSTHAQRKFVNIMYHGNSQTHWYFQFSQITSIPHQRMQIDSNMVCTNQWGIFAHPQNSSKSFPTYLLISVTLQSKSHLSLKLNNIPTNAKRIFQMSPLTSLP
jgi:hypothetical protein